MYCGTDIIEVSRIKDAIDTNYDFKYKVFSVKEIEDIDKVNSMVTYQRYAGRFAAKEAVYKAISKILIPNNVVIQPKEIEILNVEELKRRPVVNILNKQASDLLSTYSIDVSISHVKDNAIAMCVVNLGIIEMGWWNE